VQPFNATLLELEQHVAGTRTQFSNQGIAARHTGVRSMNGTENPAAGGETANSGFTQADLDRTRAEAHAAGVKAGAEAERTRITGIYGHAEAAGRRAMADKCVSMGLSVDQAGELLAAAPKEAAQAGADPLSRAMAGITNPAIGSDAADPTETTAEAEAAKIVAFASRRTK
jgi:hypothetical protein